MSWKRERENEFDESCKWQPASWEQFSILWLWMCYMQSFVSNCWRGVRCSGAAQYVGEHSTWEALIQGPGTLPNGPSRTYSKALSEEGRKCRTSDVLQGNDGATTLWLQARSATGQSPSQLRPQWESDLETQEPLRKSCCAVPTLTGADCITQIANIIEWIPTAASELILYRQPTHWVVITYVIHWIISN